MNQQFVNVYSMGWCFLRTHMFCNMRTTPDQTAERLRKIYARRYFQGVNVKAFQRGNA